MSEKIYNQINEDIKAAMLAKERVRLETLRSMKKEFLEAKTAKGGDGTINDDKAISIMQRMVKQRKESASIYSTQKRPELADAELAEAKVIEEYLPTQLSIEELTDFIKGLVAKESATGMQDMGKIMGIATKELTGKSDGKSISSVVRTVLSSI